jgi:hypothetical protein
MKGNGLEEERRVVEGNGSEGGEGRRREERR